MIDHVSVGVRDLDASARFYEPLLATLGYSKLEVRDETIGFGKRYAEFWLNLRKGLAPAQDGGGHVALRARSIEMVEEFHAAGLAHGGIDAGAPGLRPQHGPGYYAAYVRDADGNCVEAVTFLSEVP
jgi:catechol 2,3-dioxygenase-like lactoylglutathione lyase family enzyme